MSTATLTRANIPTDLHIADRCDRCNAQAFVAVTPSPDSLSALLFCGHHYQTLVEPFYLERGIDPHHVLDCRDRININPSESSA